MSKRSYSCSGWRYHLQRLSVKEMDLDREKNFYRGQNSISYVWHPRAMLTVSVERSKKKLKE